MNKTIRVGDGIYGLRDGRRDRKRNRVKVRISGHVMCV
jgi:hypothetical protein